MQLTAASIIPCSRKAERMDKTQIANDEKPRGRNNDLSSCFGQAPIKCLIIDSLVWTQSHVKITRVMHEVLTDPDVGSYAVQRGNGKSFRAHDIEHDMLGTGLDGLICGALPCCTAAVGWLSHGAISKKVYQHLSQCVSRRKICSKQH